MSLVTVSTKKNRVYRRKFDHDLARELHAQGWSYGRIAREMGVAQGSVSRVCDPKERKRRDEVSLAWARNNRQPCKGGCGALVWTHVKGRTGYCPACTGIQKAKDNAREDALCCTKCGEWKPDEAFRMAGKPHRARRGRQSHCRACERSARQAYRDANREQERAYWRDYKRAKKAA